MGNYVSFMISGMIHIQRNSVLVYSLCGIDQAMLKLDCFTYKPSNVIESLASEETCLIHFAAFSGKGDKWRIMIKCEDQEKGNSLMAIPEIRTSLKRRLNMVTGDQQSKPGWLKCHIFGFMTTSQTHTKAVGMAVQIEPFGEEAYHVSEKAHPVAVQAIGPRDQGVFLFMIRKEPWKKDTTILAALNAETFGGNLDDLPYLGSTLDQLVDKF